MSIKELSNFQVVVIAVAVLDGDINFIDREDIAIKVNELAPGRFNWRKYTENIDLDAVGVALRDAKKLKNRNLLVGSNIQGWMLSPAGIKWIISINIDSLTGVQSLKHRKDSIGDNQELEPIRMRSTTAYKLFIQDKLDELTTDDFNQFARVNEYYQINTRKRRIAVIDNAVTGDEELAGLWITLKEKFVKEDF